MPNTKSAMKAMRVAERNRARNKPIRTGVRSRVRRAEHEIVAGSPEEAQQLIVQAVKALDKAAQKGVIHRNNAARHKSRLMLKFNKALGQPSATESEAEAPRSAARKPRKAATATRKAGATTRARTKKQS